MYVWLPAEGGLTPVPRRRHCPARQRPIPCSYALLRRIATACIALAALLAAGCGVIPFDERPAHNYDYGSAAPLRIAVIDATAGGAWTDAVGAATNRYTATSPHLAFQNAGAGANVVVTVREYQDSDPPALRGYLFPLNAGGFAAVYDPDGQACNFPPSPLPLNCTGEIATADIYVNDIIPPGPDIAARRERLVLHELGHALGLTRHSPDLDLAHLAERYGWPAP